MEKGKKYIIGLFILLLILITMLIMIKFKEETEDTTLCGNYYNKEETEDTILCGNYYNSEKTGEVVIFDDGNACYFPDFEDDYCYYGEYTYENGILTINDGSAYWKFRKEELELTLYKYKYAGEVHICKDNKETFSYHKGKELNILRYGCYKTATLSPTFNMDMSISVGKRKMLLDIGGSNNPGIWGEYTKKEDIITITDETDNESAILQLKDGKILLKSYVYLDEYYEFSNGEVIFEFEYK